MSDRVRRAPPGLDQRIDDPQDGDGRRQNGPAALLGISEGGPLAALFAATYPERCRALVLSRQLLREVASPTREGSRLGSQLYRTLVGQWRCDALVCCPLAQDDPVYQSLVGPVGAAWREAPPLPPTLVRMNSQIDINGYSPRRSACRYFSSSIAPEIWRVKVEFGRFLAPMHPRRAVFGASRPPTTSLHSAKTPWKSLMLIGEFLT